MTEVRISEGLYSRIEARIKGKKEFASVSDYVELALTRLLDRLEASKEKTASVDEEKVKGRLRALGYID